MTLSRRRLLAGVPVVAGLVTLAGCGSRDVINVRDFGARGDGVTDDSAAIEQAAAALRSHTTLHFPSGSYRFAKQGGPAAMVISAVTDVAVEFAPGAELVLDNINRADRTGTGHGILVRGPAEGITLRNIMIRWAEESRRSLGDGIRVEGLPDVAPAGGWAVPHGRVTGISLRDCVVQNSPQTGVVMVGASKIAVRGLRVQNSGADGLHFNACREARIRGLSTSDTGDDGLALVTYFEDAPAYDRDAGTFAFPELTDWSNTDFDIADVSVTRSAANGVRLAGARQVTLRGVDVSATHAGAAVMVDSAAPGTDTGWHYVASCDIRIIDVSSSECHSGIHVLARPGSSGRDLFTEFGVQIDEAHLDRCENWAVHAESLSTPPVAGVHIAKCTVISNSMTGGNGGLGIDRARNVSLGQVSITHAEPVVAFRTQDADLSVEQLTISIDNDRSPAGGVRPGLVLHGSGAIDQLHVRWPGAPASWAPVQVSVPTGCAQPPVTIRRLRVHTPHGHSGVQCS